uniref:Uncharacterized protein LOC101503129 isoform X2 n=1 Tax=Cicer arietinum TaxID=3827 RepID=A0A3Q7Y840_CICAR|nr:uncharacterized protein LOC101503129 isoform X2 [Cicer arietinum]
MSKSVHVFFLSQIHYIDKYSNSNQVLKNSILGLIWENRNKQMDQIEEEEKKKIMEGVASIALLPNGSISGHFIHLPHSTCYGLHASELECERECSRGEDYRLIKLTITDFNTKKERVTVAECKGHDAARFNSIDHVHGPPPLS